MEEELASFGSYHDYLLCTPDELRTGNDLEDVLVRPLIPSQHVYRLLTTHSPSFLGLKSGAGRLGLWNTSNMGEGIVVGIVDMGIDPDHPSFSGHEMAPPNPRKWKGWCYFNKTSTCTNKLIGARSFERWKLIGAGSSSARDRSTYPLDHNGHSTHVASTAAGAFVAQVSDVFGSIKDETASGMAPRAHIAFYEVSDQDETIDHDVLAEVDAAIHDGVDIISLLLVANEKTYDSNLIYPATFSAMAKGIVVCAAAGNDGPLPGTVNNDAPWILMVRQIELLERMRSSATCKSLTGRQCINLVIFR